MSRIIVTGAGGQIGGYMVEYLLENTDHEIYPVFSSKRDNSYKYVNHSKVMAVIHGNLCDNKFVEYLIRLEPDYFINLAGQGVIDEANDDPISCFQINTLAVIDILENIVEFAPHCRFFSAGSIKQFEDSLYCPQGINHPQKPLSIYAASKCTAYNICEIFKKNHNLYIVTGILSNTESKHRDSSYVSRTITMGVARIKKEMQDFAPINPIKLQNFDAKCDWNDCEDIVDGIWKMLNRKSPKNYILSSGETHSVKEFVEIAFDCVEINGFWEQTSPLDICFKCTGTGLKLAEIDKTSHRAASTKILCGDSSPIKVELGWKPKTSFRELVAKMIKSDLDCL